MKEFKYNCIYPDNSEELSEIVDNMIPISGKTFFKYVSLDELQNSLLYHLREYYTTKNKVIKDYSVNFYKYKNKYIFQHSMIEYIFE